jgi:hypothetical protein
VPADAAARANPLKPDESNLAEGASSFQQKSLSVWFWAAYLVASQTPGMSAVQFQRQLGLTRYETAFGILHKLRAGMVRPDQDRIGGRPKEHIEVDDTWVGISKPTSTRFRFNRRFYPFNAFRSLLGIAGRAEAPTYADLYSGTWKHPTSGGCLR